MRETMRDAPGWPVACNAQCMALPQPVPDVRAQLFCLALSHSHRLAPTILTFLCIHPAACAL